MAKYELELTDLEDQCMTYVIDGTKDWIDLTLKARARKAKDEIVLLNMKHCNANGIAIAENEEKQVQQAFDLKIVKTAKEREAELKLPE